MATHAAPRFPLPSSTRPAALRSRLREVLPHGRTLPAAEFARRHRALLAVLWLHVAALPLYGLVRGLAGQHVGLEGLAVGAVALAATLQRGERHQRRAAALVALGLLTASAVLVHLSAGRTEAHFHFLIVVVALALYEDWVPFSLAGAFVALHHGGLGLVAPELVFSHEAAIADPLLWAAIHTGAVAATGAACVVAWRLNEDVRQRHRETEASLARSALDLERSNRELEQFAHIASHDLIEPLRTVSGFLELLERGGHADAVDERGRAYLRHAAEGAHRLEAMIDGLLVSSRSGRAGRPEARVELDRVAGDVLAALSRLTAERGARVRVGPLPVVRGDAAQLRQVLQNLVHNAIKFTPADRAPDVTVRAERCGATWTIAVTDGGIGIAPEAAERVFAMFQRGDADRGASAPGGEGIGLGVCRRIVTRHGGRIWAEAAPGGGTVVRFSLPAAD